MSTSPANPTNVSGIMRISDLKNTDLTPQQYDGEARLGEIVIDVSTPLARANPRMWIGNVSGNLFQVAVAIANGNTGEVQFNNGGQFAASNAFVWDAANSTLRITGNIVASGNIGSPNGVFTVTNLTANGNIVANGDLTTNGNAFFNGDITSNGNLIINGDTIHNGNIIFEGNIITREDVINEGNVFNVGNVYNNATTFLNGETISNGNMTVNGDLTTTGNVFNEGTVYNNANVYNNATTYLNGNTISNGNMTVNGDLTTTGNVFHEGNVYNNATTYLNGDTISNGNMTVNGDLTTTGNVYHTGDVYNNAMTYLNGDTVSNGNITVNGDLTTTGNVFNLGDVTNNGNTFLNGDTVSTGNVTINGNLLTTGDVLNEGNVTNNANTFLNGPTFSNSNVTIAGTLTANGDITGNSDLSIAGNITGNTLTITGNVVVDGDSNMGNVVEANYFIGNFIGTLANGTSNVAIPVVDGNVVISVGGTDSVFVVAPTAATLTGELTVTTNAVVGGNLFVDGDSAYFNTANLAAESRMLTLGTAANGAPVVADDNLDRGLLLSYYTTSDETAFMGWDDSAGEFVLADSVNVVGGVVSVNSYGNVRADTFLGDGQLVDLNVTGLSNLGSNSNVTILGGNAGEILHTDGAGSLYWSVPYNIANGTSNVALATLDGPVTMGISGVADVFTFTSTELLAPNIITILADGYVGVGQGAGALTAANSVRIGNLAGSNSPAASNSVHIGALAGNGAAAANTVAIGREAGTAAQGANAIAIGTRAGASNQGVDSVVIGTNSGNNIGQLSVAIGARAVANNASVNTITINATGANINASTANALYIKPVRNVPSSIANVLFYDQGSGEVSYAAASLLTGSVTRISNGTSNVEITSTGGNILMGVNGTASVFDIGATDTTMLGNLLPTGNKIYNLGSATQAWGNLYLSPTSLWLGAVHVTSDDVDTVNIPRANIGNLDVVGNITAAYGNINGNFNVVSTLTAANANIGNLIISNSIFTTITVTSHANVANFRANGIANLGVVGNVIIAGGTNGQVLTTNGSGNLSWTTVDKTTLVNGNSNVTVVANGNVNTSSGGNANVFVVTPTGANVNGTLDVSSTSNFAADANFAANVNITGNTLINGNLTVNGNTNYVNVNGLQVEDPIIEVGGGPNGANLIINDGKDRGLQLHYYTTQPVDAFMGWDNSNGEFAFASNATLANDVATMNQFGNIRAANYIGNGLFTNLTANGIANLGAVGNVRITGGTNGQSLLSYGNGAVYWGQPGAASVMENGNSNIVINPNSNIYVSVTGVSPTAVFESDRLVVNQLEIESDSIYLGFDAASVANSISIGRAAGNSGQAQESIAIGMFAGQASQATQAIAIGKLAGSTNQATQAVAVGLQAGVTAQGSQSVAVGAFAGNTTQGSLSVAVGFNAGKETQGARSVAVGNSAGASTQSTDAVAVGSGAGNNGQRSNAVAIGGISGSSSQGNHAVAVGYSAGTSSQGNFAVAIGSRAGNALQGVYSVAIGANAGVTSQANNSIVINASGSNLNAITANSFIVNPVRVDSTNNSNVMFYNFATKEITYAPMTSVNFNTDRISNGSSNVAVAFDGPIIGYANGVLAMQVYPASVGNSTVSLGANAGSTSQGFQSVAIGLNAASDSQGSFSVAVGSGAATNGQGEQAIAIGRLASQSGQAERSIAIGAQTTAIVSNAIALGYAAYAGHANSIAIGANTQTSGADQLHIAPVRYNANMQLGSNFMSMFYNTSTKEIGAGPLLYVGWGNTRVGVTGENGTGYVRAASNANVMTWSNTGVQFSAQANLGNIANVKILGGSAGQLIQTDGAGTLTFVDQPTPNFANFAGNVTESTQPNITSVGTLTSLTVSGVSNLNTVGNVKITGGSNGQYLRTDGTGNLSWAAVSLTSLVNGNSNVVVAANGNVSTSVTGVANVQVVTSTGVNVAGTVTATGNITGGNIVSGGQANITGNITGGNLITGGSATVTGNVSAGNANISGTVTTDNLTVTGLSNLGFVNDVTLLGGANRDVLRTNGSGVLYWDSIPDPVGLVNGTSNITIPQSSGPIRMAVDGVANLFVLEKDTIIAPNFFYIYGTITQMGSNSATGLALTGCSTKIGGAAGKLSNVGIGTTMVGWESGYQGANGNVTLIGNAAGRTNAGDRAIALGAQSGFSGMGANSIVIGATSGNNIGVNSVAIGTNGVANAAANNTLTLNATGSNITASTANAFYVAPIRQDTANTSTALFYNTTTKEVTYSSAAASDRLINLLYGTESVFAAGTTTAISLTYGTSPSVIFSSGATANITVNYTNVNATQAVNTLTTVAVIINQGATPRSVSEFRLDSTLQSVKWVGGSVPVGVANCTQVFTYTAFKTAVSTWTVLGQETRYQ